ncbi:MAG: C4-dicarboxylate transporter DcuC [Sutterellaceae bacterium]|nr:C4-dicarboxylate transporter DcuC [Sutterellaceae bacterium]MDY2867570.1 C4-dicarboxylate transporter DcuC [Mesosutterella sp.]
MALTGWIAILVVVAMIYLLVKHWETRLVLMGGGLILCVLSLAPMDAFNAFAKTMTNAVLITAICGATGFAYCVTYTQCDRSLVHYLSKPIRNVGLLLIPATTVITFGINIAIPSAVGVGAVVGTTLIPIMLRAGIKPAAAAAAVLAGTTGSLLSPGLSHNAMISDMAHMPILDLIQYHAPFSLMIGAIGAIGVTVMAVIFGDGKGEKVTTDDTNDGFRPSPIRAIVPLIPIVLMLVFTFFIPSVPMGVAQAMLIGTVVCIIVGRPGDVQVFSKEFFRGMGDSYGEIMGIIIAAGVLAAGLKASGLIEGLTALMIQSKEIAQWGGSIGPFILSVVMGSGDAGAMAFNSAVTPQAADFGMQVHSLGSLAFLSGAAGRTASPIAGITILVAGLAHANPFDVVKRTALPMLVAVILLAIFMR